MTSSEQKLRDMIVVLPAGTGWFIGGLEYMKTDMNV